MTLFKYMIRIGKSHEFRKFIFFLIMKLIMNNSKTKIEKKSCNYHSNNTSTNNDFDSEYLIFY